MVDENGGGASAANDGPSAGNGDNRDKTIELAIVKHNLAFSESVNRQIAEVHEKTERYRITSFRNLVIASLGVFGFLVTVLTILGSLGAGAIVTREVEEQVEDVLGAEARETASRLKVELGEAETQLARVEEMRQALGDAIGENLLQSDAAFRSIGDSAQELQTDIERIAAAAEAERVSQHRETEIARQREFDATIEGINRTWADLQSSWSATDATRAVAFEAAMRTNEDMLAAADARIVALEGQIETGMEEAAKAQRAMFENAVVAFADRDSCSDGWVPFAEGEGRFVLGASDDYEVGTIGGWQQITLQSSNLPAHQHRSGVPGSPRFVFEYSDMDIGQPFGWASRNDHGDDRRLYLRSYSGSLARNSSLAEPFDNMPPYIALTLCKLEAAPVSSD